MKRLEPGKYSSLKTLPLKPLLVVLRKEDIVYIFVFSDTKTPKVGGIRVRNLISESMLTFSETRNQSRSPRGTGLL